MAELREFALNLLDKDVYSTWQIMDACNQYIDNKWGLNQATKKEYVDWMRLQLKEIFAQRERRRFQRM